MIRRPPRSTLFPTRRSSDLAVRTWNEGRRRAPRGEPGQTKVPTILIGAGRAGALVDSRHLGLDRKSTRLNSSHDQISYAVFCLKKKKHSRNSIAVSIFRYFG